MSWATRGTLILGVPWGLFVLLLAASSLNPQAGAAFVVFWALFLLAPCAIVWILLVLIFGDRGRIRRY